MAGTVATAEVARFDALAARWWDPQGPMRALHAMNPARIGWIDDRLAPGAGRLLDVGCGAGIASEALARRGHAVLGLDAAAEAIATAAAHAAGGELALEYRVGAPEQLLGGPERFEAIAALEVIEHVPDPRAFLSVLAGLLAPGGVVFISTLNRTARSLLLAKLGAEYVLRLLPVGTHDWHRFLSPAELAGHARAAGLRVTDSTGLVFDPWRGRWRTGPDLAVNYMLALRGS